MSSLAWEDLFQEEAPVDHSHPISAAPGKLFISATRIEQVTEGGRPVLTFGADTIVSLENWHLSVGSEARLLLLASAGEPGLEGRTIAWCRFPYRTDLFECSRFVRGRNRDESWRQAQRERFAKEANPVEAIKRELVNFIDTSNDRCTAVFGSPRQRYRHILRDKTRKDPGERGTIVKERFDKVVSHDELWFHQGEHPDLIDPHSHAAAQAAEVRWAVLPQLTAKDAKESVTGETADFTLAKEQLLADAQLVELLEDAQLGRLEFGDIQISDLHEAVRERATEVLSYAVERALCGPHDVTKLPASRRVSALARRIAAGELHNQDRRWKRWGGVITEEGAPAGSTSHKPRKPVTSSRMFRELVEDLRAACTESHDGDARLLACAKGFLEPDIDPMEVPLACAALFLLLEQAYRRPKLAVYVERLASLAETAGWPQGLVQIAEIVLAAAK